jgi:hypothetical protein
MQALQFKPWRKRNAETQGKKVRSAKSWTKFAG